MKDFEAVLAYSFRDPSLLERALTHSSYANEHRDRAHNERLEFLGDAVLELVSSDYLFRHFEQEPEGSLSRRRAALVCESALALCARKLGLGERLLLGKGEDKSGGRDKDSLLADAMEAVIGAIYLDGGFQQAQGFIKTFLLEDAPRREIYYDAKTRLQEYLQQKGEIEIRYQCREETAPHQEKIFLAEVYAEGKCLGAGEGHNKKQAEQQAAARALSALTGDGPE